MMIHADASRSIKNAHQKVTYEIECIRIKLKKKGGFWIFQTHQYTSEELLKSPHHQKIDSITKKLGDDVKNWHDRGRLSDSEIELYHDIRDDIDQELHTVNKEILQREPTWPEKVAHVLDQFVAIVKKHLPIIQGSGLVGWISKLLSGGKKPPTLPPGNKK